MDWSAGSNADAAFRRPYQQLNGLHRIALFPLSALDEPNSRSTAIFWNELHASFLERFDNGINCLVRYFDRATRLSTFQRRYGYPGGLSDFGLRQAG